MDVANKGNMRDLYSDGNVLYLDGINVNVLLLWGLGRATRQCQCPAAVGTGESYKICLYYFLHSDVNLQLSQNKIFNNKNAKLSKNNIFR